MLGRQRLYFMLPDIPSARSMLDELLLARIEIRHMHFWARDGDLPDDMPDATFFHKTDLTHGAEMGLLVGGLMGFAGGLWLLLFPPEWVQVSMVAVFVTTITGAVLGSWMSGMAAAAIPNSRLKNFHADIASGKVLLLIDVPFKRIEAIEDLIASRHPEASFRGVEPHIPVFP
ncbi:DUF1269 domain-containing protein [Herbaspirillum sp. meg3]|jgi:hypothetical protein|uniref:DUF1269 domain-containing protein n=1 Tax=Herbaspirillum sp. meg3 TaxID=2025949 RepID=UPI000B98A733|nr:DUF1269 domain-containing protein [Herbaspirillum sp. meg3]ASU37797.1 DUF1269 domain-containing protein [Herbaspirillum sp. meg3]